MFFACRARRSAPAAALAAVPAAAAISVALWAPAAGARPVPPLTAQGLPNVLSDSALAVDWDSGEVLYRKQPDRVRPIASLTKLAAALAVVDDLDLDAAQAITRADVAIGRGGARSRLLLGSTFSNRDLLHAALMASDNRAVPALGRSAGLPPDRLVQRMNEVARGLGLRSTRLRDPVGMDGGSVSTAAEVLALLRAALAHPVLAAVMRTREYTARARGPRRYLVPYRNTNLLLRDRDLRVIGGKTGYIGAAGYCLASAVRTRTGRRVGLALLGARGKLTRFGDSRRILDWLPTRPAPAVAAE